MNNQQCYTVTEVIAALKKHRKPDDVIIFDYLCANDIKKTLSVFYPEIGELSKQKIEQIMYLFNRCDFDMQYLNSTIAMYEYLNDGINKAIAELLIQSVKYKGCQTMETINFTVPYHHSQLIELAA